MFESSPSPALREDEDNRIFRETARPQGHIEAVAGGRGAVPEDLDLTPLSGSTEVGEEEVGEYCEAPCKHHPISTKYPSSLDRPHVNNLHKFIRDVSRALKTSYPRTRDICTSHDKAHILFLRWEEDDLGTQSEIDELRPLMQNLRFTAEREALTTEQYDIPSDDPQDSLEEILVSRRNRFAKRPRDLFVIYYGGHGEMNKQRQCIWYPWLNPPQGSYERPEIVWTSLQQRLQTCEGDVVFILDCCYASSMVRGSHSAWNGFKELLVASGKHEKTEGVNDNSFTRSIIRELKKLKGKATSISGLQAALVENQEIHGLRNTPIRIGLSERANRFESLSLVYPHSFHQSEPIENLDSTALDYGARVLISIRLRNPANPVQVRDWLPWLQRQAPQDILDLKLKWTNYVRPEAGFHHGSTLLFFSMPLTMWNVLPSDASYSFIDVIRSGNLIDPNVGRTNVALESLSNLPTISSTINDTPNTWPRQRQRQEDEDTPSTASLESLRSSVASPDSQSKKKASHLAMPTSSGHMGGDQLQSSTMSRTGRLTSLNDVSDFVASEQPSMDAGSTPRSDRKDLGTAINSEILRKSISPQQLQRPFKPNPVVVNSSAITPSHRSSTSEDGRAPALVAMHPLSPIVIVSVRGKDDDAPVHTVERRLEDSPRTVGGGIHSAGDLVSTAHEQNLISGHRDSLDRW